MPGCGHKTLASSSLWRKAGQGGESPSAGGIGLRLRGFAGRTLTHWPEATLWSWPARTQSVPLLEHRATEAWGHMGVHTHLTEVVFSPQRPLLAASLFLETRRRRVK